jgi:hypothetical protein
MAALWCVVIWNGDENVIFGKQQLTAATVLASFARKHPDLHLHLHHLGLFNAGGIELEPDDVISTGDELVLRPRVI